ncbi:MAG: acetyl-CoA synthase, partial [Methanoregula sp.]|nr:acetyl-CoA synthase [Methanoregula sp.]
MAPDNRFDWTGTVGSVVLGATKTEGGTRKISYRIGGGSTLPFLSGNASPPSPLVALEICDTPGY